MQENKKLKKNSKHIIIFSHGFGNKKDSRGLFTFLSEQLSQNNIESILFDYNEINDETNEIFVKSFSEQAKILKEVFEKVKKENPDAIIDIITHSQGSMPVSLANLKNIRKVILLAPFFHTEIKEIVKKHKENPSNIIDFDKISKRFRSDGSITIIPPKYWSERFNTDIYELYNNLALKTDLVIIRGNKDEIMPKIKLDKISNINIINIHANHDFNISNSREKLLSLIRKIILNK
jgi:hypothetical protein